MKNSTLSIKSSISKSEYELIERIKEVDMITFKTKDLEYLMNYTKTKVHNILETLVKKNTIIRLKRDVYTLNLFSEYHEINKIATRIYWPSYISFWSAMRYYGFTEQLPNVVYVVTTRLAPHIEFNQQKIHFVQFTPSRFFGYEKVHSIQIAQKEKAFTDSLLYPRYCGGMNEIAKCLRNAWDEIDLDILIDYCIRVKNSSIVHRLGYIIEELGCSISKGQHMKLKKHMAKGYVLLDPRRKKTNEYNKKWMVIKNTDVTEK